MKKFIDKIHSDVRLSAIFYGVISSLAATALWTYSWAVLTVAGEYSFGLLVGFIDSRYAKAATLEPTNYSYFIIAFLFIIVAIGWFEISERIKKELKSKPEPEPINIESGDNEEMPSWIPKAFLAVRLIVLFYLFNGLLFIAGEVVVINAISDFKQHVRIINPYISNEEKEVIISQWSQMRNLEDYNKVYEGLISVAKENDLKLYKNRSY